MKDTDKLKDAVREFDKSLKEAEQRLAKAAENLRNSHQEQTDLQNRQS